MIFYFSGTGNSEWAAKKIAEKINDKIINIVGAGDSLYTFEKDQTVGIVFPVYAWGPPQVVIDFSRKIITNGSFVFAIGTCGENIGNTMKILSKVLPLNSGYSIIMPNNYMIFGDVDNMEDTDIKIEKAKIRIDNICANIKNRLNVFDISTGKFIILKSLINYMFNKSGRSAKPFYAKDSCTSCGLCEKICPSKIITIKEGRPFWGEKCYQCLACVNRCPQKAIEYGKATAGKGRYYFPQI